MTDSSSFPNSTPPIPQKCVIPPSKNEVITSLLTGNTYTMGDRIDEGFFGTVYACVDIWNNDLAAKVLKPIGTYEHVQASALVELQKLVLLRHPYITYIYDAFEFRDTFYIIMERCYCPLKNLFPMKGFNGLVWIKPIARCLLQAIQYIHLNKHAHQDIHPGNVFTSFAKDEMQSTQPGSIQFKLGDLGVAKLFQDLDAKNTRADWMLPPEAINVSEFGPIDQRIDIYHVGLLFLQLAHSRVIRFTQKEILAGLPREMAMSLPAPYRNALEKALRRHVLNRTASAMELWQDLCTPN